MDQYAFYNKWGFLAEEEPTLPGDNVQGYYKFSNPTGGIYNVFAFSLVFLQ